jgi:UDP-4-amino-4,6-dideoxy-N-acetyl-beta-L-altrosamine transaminase
VIGYGRQSIDESDIDAVREVLRGDWLTQGPAVARFEQELAVYCGATGAVAVSSGTAALHLACLALGFGHGDVLWTSPITFVSSANCARFCGGEVDFVDIDPHTYNLCPDALEQKLDAAERAGLLPKILIPVHFAGQACDMARIHALSRRYGFRIIEDASHALGGRYRGKPIGNGEFADFTVFSFHPVKSITTGEGGALTASDSLLLDAVRQLRSHGVVRPETARNDPLRGGWYYEQRELGFNYRLTDIQAALGSSQLKRLDGFVAERQQLARRYQEKLQSLPLRLPSTSPDSDTSWHLYPVCFDDGAETRRRVYDALLDAGIRTQVHYIPVHTQPYYRARGFAWGDFPVAESYYASALSLPLYPGLAPEQQDRVIDRLSAALVSGV